MISKKMEIVMAALDGQEAGENQTDTKKVGL
jgi:hypothetical protein